MSDTSAIDEKISGLDDELPSSKLTRFIQKLNFLVKLTLYCFISGAVLFACKVGQSNLLPSDINCAPFTSNNVTYKVKSKPVQEGDIELDIFKVGGFLNPTHSEKITFNAKHNIDFFILEQTIKSDSYVALVIRDILVFNFTYLGMFFGMLNQIPEALIIILGPLITAFFLFVVFLPTGAVYSAYAVVKNGWPEFNFPFDMYNFKKYGIAAGVIGLFFLLFFIGGFLALSLGSMLSAIFSIINMNATMGSVGVGPIQTGIKTIVCYKDLFVAVICIFITLAVHSVFKKWYFLIPVIIVAFLTFKGVWEFHKGPTVEENPELTPLSKQNSFIVKKRCVVRENISSLHKSQSGGYSKNLSKEIIRVGKNLEQFKKKRK